MQTFSRLQQLTMFTCQNILYRHFQLIIHLEYLHICLQTIHCGPEISGLCSIANSNMSISETSTYRKCY